MAIPKMAPHKPDRVVKTPIKSIGHLKRFKTKPIPVQSPA